MTILTRPSDDELALWYVMTDPGGVDSSEFLWQDPEKPDGCFRCHSYQIPWWRTREERQIDLCIAAGELVLTDRGEIPIENVVIGTMVWTHQGRWRPVTAVHDRGEQPVVEVSTKSRTLTMTADHKVYALVGGEPQWAVPSVGLLWAAVDPAGAFRWEEILGVSVAGLANTYDLTVYEDSSFTVNGGVVTNCGRDLGKSLGIAARCFNFAFRRPGQQRALVAPELNHLNLLIGAVENRLESSWITRQMLRPGNKAFTHRPFNALFLNGSTIEGRIPQRDGRGFKGCVAVGTLVLTDRGYIPAEEVVVGDLVLTHTGSWKPVIEVLLDTAECLEVTGQSSYPITMSSNHLVYGAMNLATKKQKRRFLPVAWHYPEELIEDQVYWATPKYVEPLPLPKFTSKIESWAQSADFWWLVGRYIADGFLSSWRGLQHRISWVVTPSQAPAVTDRLTRLGIHWIQKPRDFSSADVVETCGKELHAFMLQFGHHNSTKAVPSWVFGRPFGKDLLTGYISGDGTWCHERNRYEAGSASKKLILGMKLLAQEQGFTTNVSKVQPQQTHIKGVALKKTPQVSWRLQINNGNAVDMGKHFVSYVRGVEPVGERTVVDIIVDEDHSYVAESIVQHNLHAVELEADEAQDIAEQGWHELVETVKRSLKDFRFMIHGVTRGVHDTFYRLSMPDSGYYVHRIVGMHRPTWTDKERQQKIQEYGGYDSPDFRRNVLGAHGDEQSPLFPLAILMTRVDADTLSQYNAIEYRRIDVNGEEVGPEEDAILSKLDFPSLHLQQGRYERFWIGMDVGVTIHPSEILVFGEYKQKSRDEDSTLRLLLRVHMMRVKTPHQAEAIRWLISQYRPTVFAMDSTGVGLPIVQQLQVWAEREALDPTLAQLRQETERTLSTIKGYNFSAKVPVGIQEPYTDSDGVEHEEELIMRNVQNAATDVLRTLVDGGRLELPWDKDLIGQFQGQTFTNTKSSLDAYGKRSYCVDGETEALVRDRGWCRYGDIKIGDEVWALDTDLDQARWSTIHGVYVDENYQGSMLSLESSMHSSLTTRNHRWWVRTNYNEDKWVLSQDLAKYFRIPRSAPPLGLPTESPYPDDFVALVAWFWTEGSFRWRGGIKDQGSSSIVISQSFTANPAYCEDIRRQLNGLLGECRYPYSSVHGWSESEHKGKLTFRVSGPIADEIMNICPAPDKVVNPSFLCSLTLDQLNLFIETSIDADGCRSQPANRWVRKDGTKGYCVSIKQKVPERLKSFELACALAGRSTNTHPQSLGMHRTAVMERGYVSSRTSKWVDYSGTIWCPTTDAGTWLARRNGSVYFTGNSLGTFHALDAARVGCLAYSNYKLEEMLRLRTKAEKPAEIFLSFLE